jgi:hypothetical protein
MLASLNESELATLRESLVSLKAPFNARNIEEIARLLHEQVGRLSENEWRDALHLIILPVLRDADVIGFLADSGMVGEEDQERVVGLLRNLSLGPSVAKELAIERFLEQGPRLKRLNWFCDIRTKFSKIGDTQSSLEAYRPQEEFRLPIATIRLEIDETDSPIYFQMAESELREFISALERAHKQLRCIAEKER